MWAASSGRIVDFKEEFVYNTIDRSEQELKLLCELLIPPELLSQLSPTYAARFFALNSRLIAPIKEDPTYDKELWNHITKVSISLTYDIGLLVKNTYKEENINVEPCSNAYTQLCEPRIRKILDNLVTMDTLNIAKMWISDMHVRQAENIKNIFLAVGSKKEYYDDPDVNHALRPASYTARALESDFRGTLAYFIRQGFDVNTPREPLLLQGMAREYGVNADRVFGRYTTTEIQEFYLPYFFKDRDAFISEGFEPSISKIMLFSSRNDMINHVTGGYMNDGFKWIISSPDLCNNDDKLDVVSGSLRGETRREDKVSGLILKDPNLVYSPNILGARRRCFRASELTRAFQENQYGFEYLDPDWLPAALAPSPESLINPLTNKALERTFPMYIIIQLYSYLKPIIRDRSNALPEDAPLRQLFNKISLGIREHNSVDGYLRSQMALINGHPEWRNDLLIYFSWLFLFAMWIRFWKGPGTDYPTIWVERSSETCEYRQRDQHINIELSVYGNLISVLEAGNPELATYVKTLPFMYYTWSTGEINKPAESISRRLLKVYTIDEIIGRVQMDAFCMAQASDIFSGTSFIYLTEVMKIPRNRLNDLLLQVMKLLRQYEKFSIDSRDSTVLISDMKYEDKTLALEVIQQHRNILNVGNNEFVQPRLNLANVNETAHLPQGFGELIGIE